LPQPPSYFTNFKPSYAKFFKFQIELDETSCFDHELEKWKAYKTVDDPLPPLVLEVYLDNSEVARKEMLSVVSEHGVCNLFGDLQVKSCDEIMLERWKVEYSPTKPEPDQDFYHVMPKFYKECIIYFRALYTMTSLLPAWRLWSQIKKDTRPTNRLAIRCRIGSIYKEDDDMLSKPVFDGESSPATDQVLPDKIQAPLGSLSAQVTYRKECRFFVESNDGTAANMTMDRGNWSLDQEDESQPRRSQRRMRSSSWPMMISRSDVTSIRPRIYSLSTRDAMKSLWSVPVNTDSENKPSNHFANFLGNPPKNEDSTLRIPESSAAHEMSLPTPEVSQPLAPRASWFKKHKCPYCETEFTRYHNLKSHLLTHSQDKPYSCQTCLMRFRRLHDLKRHKKLHTGERPHICPTCDRKFARAEALERHSKPNGCSGRRLSTGNFGGDDDFERLDMWEGGAESERGRSAPSTPATPRGSRRRSSAHSRASSGRGSSPASLRNVSLAPKEFDPSVPTLRHNYSAPNLQDWSNVRARHGRQFSVLPTPNRLTRSNSLPAHDTSINEFLEFLKRNQSMIVPTETSLSSQPKTSALQSLGTGQGSFIPTDIPRRRRHSQVFDVSPPLSDDEGSVRLRVQRRRPKTRRMF